MSSHPSGGGFFDLLILDAMETDQAPDANPQDSVLGIQNTKGESG